MRNQFMESRFSIYFEQTGGFMGITFTTRLDDKNVDPVESKEILMLIRDSDFFNIDVTEAGRNPRPDGLFYIITVDLEGRKHSISIYDYQVSDDLKPLVGYLSKKARQKG